MGFFSPYTFKTKDGKVYYLHAMDRGNTTIYFFSKDEAGAMMDLPPNYEAFVSKKTGLPMLRKKKVVGLFGSPSDSKGEGPTEEEVKQAEKEQ